MDIEFLKQSLLWDAIFVGVGFVIIGIVILILWIKSRKY